MASVSVCGVSGTSAADDMTLSQALSSAVRTSAELEAASARMMATEEGIDLARSGYRPTVRGDAIFARREVETKYDGDQSALTSSAPGSLGGSSLLGSTTDSGTTTPKAYQLSVSQPIFDGFKTPNAIDRSKAESLAAEQGVRDTEARVLLAAATAYFDLLRDQEILRLRQTYSATHARELASLKKRLNVYDATHADLAQTQARWARARGQEEAARANLHVSRARFAFAVGIEAPALSSSPWSYYDHLPTTLEAAQSDAALRSPAVASATYREAAARHAIDEIRGDLLPQLAVEGAYIDAYDPSVGIKRTSEAVVYGRMTIPFYDAGVTQAKLRAAKHTHLACVQDVRRARAEVAQNVAMAWAANAAAKMQLSSGEEQLAAAERAIEGIRREAAIAARTQTEILNAEQEKIEARIVVANARHDLAVAKFSLLAAVGSLSAETLALEGSEVVAVRSGETSATLSTPIAKAADAGPITDEKWDRIVAKAIARSDIEDTRPGNARSSSHFKLQAQASVRPTSTSLNLRLTTIAE